MKKLYTTFLLTTLIHLIGFAQATLITPGGTSPSIMTNGTNSSVVLSGLTTQERDAIESPKIGQFIYNKTKGCIEFYNGFRWHNLCENDYLNTSLKNGLVAYYPFNGNSQDESGNGFNGTVYGAQLTTDRFGNTAKAYSFDNNQYIDVLNSQSNNLLPITISLWALIKTGLEGGNLFNKYIPATWNGYAISAGIREGNDWGYHIYPYYLNGGTIPNGVIGGYGKSDTVFTVRKLQPEQWIHFVMTVDNSGGRIYLNGKLVDTVEWRTPPSACFNNLTWHIGGRPGRNYPLDSPESRFFKGKIDDVGIWNRVLTQDEITYLYQNQLTTTPSIVLDADGNIYNTITLGSQVWMKENLKTTKFCNGEIIPNITSQWTNTSPAWCYYNNNSLNNNIYGKLYNFYAVEDGRNVCPCGWHVPSDQEWKQLEMFLGMTQTQADGDLWRGTNQASQLAGNSSLWQAGSLTNNAGFGTSGFNGLPGGFRYISGSFGYLGTAGLWWSSNGVDSDNSMVRNIANERTDILRYSDFKNGGRSIRCIKNN